MFWGLSVSVCEIGAMGTVSGEWVVSCEWQVASALINRDAGIDVEFLD